MTKMTCRTRLLVVTAVMGASLAVAQETEVVYLSGLGKDDPVTWEFFCTAGRNSGTWTKIGVPSSWELQGFGTYNYGHDRNKGNEQGKYRRSFTVPQSWAEKRVFIVFDGVMTDTEVFVNGKSAGPKHQGGFYRFKYEITDLVKAGENLLEVTVSKVSSDASVEDAERQADYWVFVGIYRPVWLEALPRQFIEWAAIDARADGSFLMDIHLNGSGDADVVHAEITGPTHVPPKLANFPAPADGKDGHTILLRRIFPGPDVSPHGKGMLSVGLPSNRREADVLHMKACDSEGRAITMVNDTPELFLGVYKSNDGPAPANTKLNLPETGIALLHGIPAIGTKFDKAEVLGPESRKNQASGAYRGTIRFHFGDGE